MSSVRFLFIAVLAASVIVPIACAGDAVSVVSVSGSGNSRHTSPEWTVGESSTSSWLQSAAWSGNQFVAVGKKGRILYSSDGLVWESTSRGFPLDLYDVVWSGSQFVAVGCDYEYPQSSILRSEDGINWAAASEIPGIAEGLYSIAYSGKEYVAVGYGGQIFRSIDGDVWVSIVDLGSSMGRSLYGVTWSGSRFVAVGEVWDPASSDWRALVAASSDGTDWSFDDIGRIGLLFDVEWTGREFISVGYTGRWGTSSGLIATSDDGIEWSTRILPSTNYLRAVASANGMIVAVGDDGIILISDNGIDWSRQESGTELTLSGVTSSPSRIIIVGSSGTILNKSR